MGQAQDMLKQGLDKLLSANDKHQQVVDKLKQTMDRFKSCMDTQKQAMNNLGQALGSSSSPDDAVQSMKDALDSLKDVFDSQKDAFDAEKDVSGAVKDGMAQLKDGLNTWSALQDKSSDDLTIDTGQIKEQLVAYKGELDQCNAALSNMQTQVAGLQETVATEAEAKIRELLGTDASLGEKLWAAVEDKAKEELKGYINDHIRDTILDTETHDWLTTQVKAILAENKG